MAREKEFAVNTDRLGPAMRSAAEYYCRQRRAVREGIVYLQDQIDNHGADGPESRQTLAELHAELRDLERGWENSSMRRLSARASAGAGGEERIGLAAPVSVGPTVGLRDTDADTGTSTKTAKTLFGHAAIFNVETVIAGVFRERIAPGAFASAIRTSDIRFLFNHNPDYVYGRNKAGTLTVWEDQAGLAFRCDLLRFDAPSFHLARRIGRGDVTQCSFSFTVRKDKWVFAKSYDELDLREIVEFERLWDCCACTYPAYEATDVGVTWEKVARSTAPTAEPEAEDDDQRELLEAKIDGLLSRNRDAIVRHQYQEAARKRQEAAAAAAEAARRRRLPQNPWDRQLYADRLFVECGRILARNS